MAKGSGGTGRGGGGRARGGTVREALTASGRPSGVYEVVLPGGAVSSRIFTTRAAANRFVRRAPGPVHTRVAPPSGRRVERSRRASAASVAAAREAVRQSRLRV